MAERTHQAALELLRLTDEQWALWRDVRLRALGEAPDAFSSTLAEWQGPGDARGRGVGEALVGEVVGWATGLGASAVVLSVRAENAHAIRLYQRTGFVQTDEPAEDPSEVTMRRRLR